MKRSRSAPRGSAHSPVTGGNDHGISRNEHQHLPDDDDVALCVMQDAMDSGTQPQTQGVPALGPEDDAGRILRSLHDGPWDRGRDDEILRHSKAGVIGEQYGRSFQDAVPAPGVGG